MNVAATLMTMRASIRRHPGTTDDFGGPSGPVVRQVVAEDVPCFVWVSTKREIEDGAKLVVVEDIRGVFRSDADIKRADQLYELKNRNGDAILSGILEVDSVTEKTAGPAVSHKEVSLRRHRG